MKIRYLYISLPGLDEDNRLEAAFDISVAKAPARLFFYEPGERHQY
jgi:hypothetical protein